MIDSKSVVFLEDLLLNFKKSPFDSAQRSTFRAIFAFQLRNEKRDSDIQFEYCHKL